MTGFKDLHPAILCFYYLGLVLSTVVTQNPVLVLLSLAGGISYFAFLTDFHMFMKNIFFYIIVFMVIAFANPVFSHRGETVLFYVNDNPVTLEAMQYGIFTAVMMIAVIFWCKCFQKIFTTDKFLYLAGKTFPVLAVTISMALRFIPLFKRHSEEVADVQKIMGLEKKYGKIGSRLRIYDSVLGWAMENSVDTADAMAARGFGKRKRTLYSIFKAGLPDYMILAVLFCCMAIFIYGMINGVYYFAYYPVSDTLHISTGNILFYMIYGIMAFLPFGYSFVQSVRFDRKFRAVKE